MKKGVVLFVLVLLSVLFLSNLVYSHHGEEGVEKEDIAEGIRSNSSRFLIISSIIACNFHRILFFYK